MKISIYIYIRSNFKLYHFFSFIVFISFLFRWYINHNRYSILTKINTLFVHHIRLYNFMYAVYKPQLKDRMYIFLRFALIYFSFVRMISKILSRKFKPSIETSPSLKWDFSNVGWKFLGELNESFDDPDKTIIIEKRKKERERGGRK